MVETCTCRLDWQWGLGKFHSWSNELWDMFGVTVTLTLYTHTPFMVWWPQAGFPSSSFHFPPLFLLLWPQTTVGGTWSRVVVTHTVIIYVYMPQDVKREMGNCPTNPHFFFFFLFKILRKKLGDFTWKLLFNFVRDHKMSATGFLNAIWLWGDVSVHVF